MAELAVTVARVAVIYHDQLFQMKNIKVATEAKFGTWDSVAERKEFILVSPLSAANPMTPVLP